jgi:protocatechuate 3,4-dioxygenase beta subunit
MTLSKCKIATLLLLAAGIVGTGFGFALHRSPTVQATETAREESPQDRPAPVPARRPEEKKEIAVTGRVLDDNGKPVPGAEVAVVVREVLRFSIWERYALDKTELKARTTSDADGRFHLTSPQLPPVTRREVHVLARAPGHALAWAPVDPNAREAKAELRLVPEGPIAGKVVDLSGGPVAGLKIHASRLTRKKGDGWDTLPLPVDAVTATTDERGRFAFPGIGRGLSAHLEIDDLHCAPKEMDVNTGDEKAGYLVLGVTPPQVIEGRVVCEDTGKPMPYARLDINSYTKSEEGYTTGGGAVLGQADAQGRFKISTYPGNTGFVIAMPPDGQPYLVNSTSFDWPKGTVKQEVEVKLSRGLLLHGKITEAGSGKPLANASVEYQTARDDVVKVKRKIRGGWRGRVLTAADGSYTLAVPPGPAHLLVTAPTPDYIAEPVGSAGLEIAKPGGDPFYYHATAVLDLKEDEKPKEMSFALRRGVTLKGTTVDPDGKPVKDVVLLVGGLRPPWEKALTPIEIHDGHWELRGCDPEQTYHLLFLACPEKPQLTMTAEGIGSTGRLMLPMLLGPKNKLGAAVDIPAKKAGGGPVEVRLQPTGSARLRFHDAQGKILPSHNPTLELVVSPGPTFAKAIQTGTLAGETVYLAAPIGQPGKNPPQADDAGTMIVEGLIPGATYRLRNFQQPEIFKEFTAESGKRAEVDVTVK